jgi:hypothetical protein
MAKTKKDTVQLTHSGGATVRVSKDRVETLERMGFSKSTSRSSSKSSD